MEASTATRQIGDWQLKLRQPPGEGPFPVIGMLHGWTGDEDSMWVFASRLPKNALLIAPRGLFPSLLSGYAGYAWHAQQNQRGQRNRLWPQVEDFDPAVAALLGLFTTQNFPQGDFSQLRLLGFSQGAALTFALGLQHPERVQALAGLAGFLPEGSAELAVGQPLLDKPVFLAHGTRDELVPVEKARLAATILERAGATVNYCEHDVGHKLNAACFRSLEIFFQDN